MVKDAGEGTETGSVADDKAANGNQGVMLQVDMRSSRPKNGPPSEAPLVTSPIPTSSSDAGNREGSTTTLVDYLELNKAIDELKTNNKLKQQ